MASQEPISAAQLTAARSTAWHLSGEQLLTLEAAHDWLNTYGLVLFAPRAQQLGAPAPSLVEATLGAANEAPSLAQTDTARSLAARLVAAGDAVPLNLLGGPGEVPDFLASAQVFSFLYTLRGDKLWKQPPATSGANKVTPLALSVYELLGQSGPLTASQIADELGRELTENAVARALHELWQHLRVIPLLQQGEEATQWELTSKRFTKAIKAGTNAGQPTALSALVSLYLAQSMLASEEEVAGFLSPVAARSRIREVLHALVAARELSELVIDGKTLLHIPGALPEFPEIEQPVAENPEAAAENEALPSTAGEAEDGSPIKRFAPGSAERDRAAYRGKPAAGGFRKDSRERAPRPSRPGADRERRPFKRDADATGSSDRPARPARPGFSRSAGSDRPERPARPARSEFARPWDEDRKPRRTESEGEARPPHRTPRSEDGADRSERSFGSRPAGKSFRPRTQSGDRPYKPRAEGDRPYRPRTESGDRPYKPRAEGDRPYRPRTESGDRPYKPRAEGDRPYRPRTESGDRPYKPRTQSGDRPYRPRTESGDRPYKPRTEGDRPYRPRTEGGDRPYKPRTEGDRPYRPRTEGAEGRPPFRRSAGSAPSDRKPYTRRPAGDGEDSPRPRRTFSSDREGSSRPRPSGDRPSFGDRPSGDRKAPYRGDKPAGKPFGRPGGAGRPASKFAGKKPFGKGPAKGAGRGPFKGTRPGGERSVRRPRSEE